MINPAGSVLNNNNLVPPASMPAMSNLRHEGSMPPPTMNVSNTSAPGSDDTFRYVGWMPPSTVYVSNTSALGSDNTFRYIGWMPPPTVNVSNTSAFGSDITFRNEGSMSPPTVNVSNRSALMPQPTVNVFNTPAPGDSDNTFRHEGSMSPPTVNNVSNTSALMPQPTVNVFDTPAPGDSDNTFRQEGSMSPPTVNVSNTSALMPQPTVNIFNTPAPGDSDNTFRHEGSMSPPAVNNVSNTSVSGSDSTFRNEESIPPPTATVNVFNTSAPGSDNTFRDGGRMPPSTVNVSNTSALGSDNTFRHAGWMPPPTVNVSSTPAPGFGNTFPGWMPPSTVIVSSTSAPGSGNTFSGWMPPSTVNVPSTSAPGSGNTFRYAGWIPPPTVSNIVSSTSAPGSGSTFRYAGWMPPPTVNVFNNNVNYANQTSGAADDFIRRNMAVYRAALNGDWDTVQKAFPSIDMLSTTAISSKLETVLHIAVSAGKVNDEFVKMLVNMIPPDKLCWMDRNQDTALHIAAAVGNTEAARLMVGKNPNLLYIYNRYGRLAVQQAAINCQRETLKFLISKYDPNPVYNSPFHGEAGIRLLIATTSSQFLDLALELVRNYPNSALRTKTGFGISALSVIAEMRTVFPRTEWFTWWQKLVYHYAPVKKSLREDIQTTQFVSSIERNRSGGNNYSSVGRKLKSMIWNVIEHLVPQAKEMKEKKARRQQALQLADYLCRMLVSSPGNEEAHAIFWKAIRTAANFGISEIVEMIIHYYPQIVFEVDETCDNGKSIFHIAAINRFENVINLLYDMNDRNYIIFDFTDIKGNNLMHECGYLAPPSRLNLVAGAALQMQRELQWFKEMENFVHPSRRVWINGEKKSPQALFTEEHEKLKVDGERWMKDTANACTIAAVLISTVMFAAIFTVPGGFESDSGIPLFAFESAFTVFALSDALSLFTSITSLLMFLSILTSRYADEDFLYVLPNRLLMGLLSLFLSISFMMLAFSATLYLILMSTQVTWFLITVAAFACLPVTSFVLLQFPLLVDVYYSTHGPGIFRNKKFIKEQKLKAKLE